MLLNIDPRKMVIVDLQEENEEKRSLYFPIARAIELEKLHDGVSILKLISNDDIISSFNFITNAYWCGLKTEDKTLTLQKTQSLISNVVENVEDFDDYIKTLNGLTEGILKAFQATGLVGKPKEIDTPEEEKETPKKAGKPSKDSTVG